MNLDKLCIQCGRLEDYPQNPNTVFTCGVCAQIEAQKHKGMSDHIEKQKVSKKRNKSFRIPFKKQTLATCDVQKRK
jgi:hypothetical protein